LGSRLSGWMPLGRRLLMLEEQGLVYFIDTSALVDLHKSHPPRNFPGVWRDMGELVGSGRLRTIDLVKEECHDEEVIEWFASYPEVVIKPFREQEDCVRQIMSDVLQTGKQFVNVQSLDSDADPFIIACVMAHNLLESGSFASGRHVLVQHENAAYPSPKKLKIPDVCGWYSVRHVRAIGVIQSENWVYP